MTKELEMYLIPVDIKLLGETWILDGKIYKDKKDTYLSITAVHEDENVTNSTRCFVLRPEELQKDADLVLSRIKGMIIKTRLSQGYTINI